MTIDEAVQRPSAKVQAWSVTPAANGLVTLALYEIGPGGAKYLAGGAHPETAVTKVREDLLRRGVPAASMSDAADYVWFEHDGGVTVYTFTAIVLDAHGERLTAGDGAWPRSAFARVIAFAARDYIKRGVKAALQGGEEVDLLVDVSTAAYSDPTYSRNELIVDAEWVVHVAVAVSRWAGLGAIDRRGI